MNTKLNSHELADKKKNKVKYRAVALYIKELKLIIKPYFQPLELIFPAQLINICSCSYPMPYTWPWHTLTLDLHSNWNTKYQTGMPQIHKITIKKNS